jgi:hypothetical protein
VALLWSSCDGTLAEGEIVRGFLGVGTLNFGADLLRVSWGKNPRALSRGKTKADSYKDRTCDVPLTLHTYISSNESNESSD